MNNGYLAKILHAGIGLNHYSGIHAGYQSNVFEPELLRESSAQNQADFLHEQTDYIDEPVDADANFISKHLKNQSSAPAVAVTSHMNTIESTSGIRDEDIQPENDIPAGGDASQRHTKSNMTTLTSLQDKQSASKNNPLDTSSSSRIPTVEVIKQPEKYTGFNQLDIKDNQSQYVFSIILNVIILVSSLFILYNAWFEANNLIFGLTVVALLFYLSISN